MLLKTHFLKDLHLQVPDYFLKLSSDENEELSLICFSKYPCQLEHKS